MSPSGHFIELARNGADPAAASSGEVGARALAECVLEHAGGLDDRAFAGLLEFAREARIRPSAALSAIGPVGGRAKTGERS